MVQRIPSRSTGGRHRGFPLRAPIGSKGRKDEREGSKLFWNLVQLIKWVEEVFSPTAAVEFVVENVLSMDAEAREEISQQLGVEPLALCPSDVLPYNRPRLAWVSSAIEAGEGVTLERQSGYTRVHSRTCA